MFSKYKRGENDGSNTPGLQPIEGGQNVRTNSRPVSTPTPQQAPVEVKRRGNVSRTPAQVAAMDKERKRKERLGEIKLELHKRLLDIVEPTDKMALLTELLHNPDEGIVRHMRAPLTENVAVEFGRSFPLAYRPSGTPGDVGKMVLAGFPAVGAGLAAGAACVGGAFALNVLHNALPVFIFLFPIVILGLLAISPGVLGWVTGLFISKSVQEAKCRYPAAAGIVLSVGGWRVLWRCLPMLLLLLIALPTGTRYYAALVVRPETLTLQAVRASLDMLPGVMVSLTGLDLSAEQCAEHGLPEPRNQSVQA